MLNSKTFIVSKLEDRKRKNIRDRRKFSYIYTFFKNIYLFIIFFIFLTIGMKVCII